jgi:hypothetical protein
MLKAVIARSKHVWLPAPPALSAYRLSLTLSSEQLAPGMAYFFTLSLLPFLAYFRVFSFIEIFTIFTTSVSKGCSSGILERFC